MGGTRNRDAKMKANKVFSGSGGGGTKGPAVVDKRGQETKCPYCDKIYTQSGRLKEHVASKHPDQGQAGGSTAASAPAAAPPPGRSAHTAKPTHPAAAALVAAAAAAAADTSSSSMAPKKVSAAPASGPAAATLTSGPSSSISIMDIGSKAGYYTHKSPKLLLLEWAQSKKLLKPRFSARQQPGGSFTCKVVLPDPKRAENDLVLFLDERFATPDAFEAEQRGAVAALHRVAGDRQMHLLLPPQYRQLWEDIKGAASQKAAEHTVRAAATEDRKHRDRERRARVALRGPKTVMMSSSKQAMLQSLLQEGFAAAAASGPGRSTTPMDPDLLAGVEVRLVPMGFSPQQVRQAGAAVAGRSCCTGAISAIEAAAELALDWLFIHLPSEQMPRQFRAATSTVTVMSKNRWAVADADGTVLGNDADLASSLRSDNGGAKPGPQQAAGAVCKLGAFGYTPSECHGALSCCEDEVSALQALYQGLTGTSVVLLGDATAATLPASWEEELMVLEAIYGPDACAKEGAGESVCVEMPIPEGSLLAAVVEAGSSRQHGREGDGEEEAGSSGCSSSGALRLQFYCPQSTEAGPGYPSIPPMVVVSCSLMPPTCLRRLTRRLARLAAAAAAAELPMLHDLVTAASEMLEGDWHMQPGGASAQDGLAPRLPLEESSGDEGAADDDGGRDEAADEQDWENESDVDEEEDVEVEAAEVAASQVAAIDFVVQQQLRDEEEDGRRRPEKRVGADAAAWPGGRAPLLGQPRPDAGEDFEEAGGADGEGASLVEDFDGLALGADDPLPLVETAGRQPADKPRPGQAAARPPARQARQALSGSAAEVEGRKLSAHQSWLQDSPGHSAMRNTRGALPAASKRAELLELMARNATVVISGATGCGKSTQVPQYILEEAIKRGDGARCNIIVTQPRRISALGLASRVADERGEEVGQTVGYSVRLDSKQSVRTRVLFCTTGVLLRRLLSDPSLDSVSHVVLDEVHERSVEIDLLLMLLRDVQQARAKRTSGCPLHLVLMSATVDAELFADYMQRQPCPAPGVKGQGGGMGGGGPQQQVGTLTIPGFTYPVREFYLEDILERTGHVVGRSSRYARKGTRGDDVWDVPGAEQYSEVTRRSMAVVDENQINYEALLDLMCLLADEQQREGPRAFLTDWREAAKYLDKKAGSSSGGAVLVFLPGAPEISRVQRMLLASERLSTAAGGRQRLRVLPLHGSLSSADQTRVFSRPPPGTLKIVLATNVAETSITIDDVSFVVDTGRAKEMTHDVERSILRLQEGHISKAAAQQRRGRAGRVRPGVCFRMFSRQLWDSLPSHTAPEMLRSPLERVALLIKGMAGHDLLSGAAGAGGIARVLGRCLSPPQPAAVAGATRLLQQIGAFDQQELLTALGGHLNRMPMDPRVGKMLVYGAMLGCLDPVLTVAAALAHGRPVFLSTVPDMQADLERSRAAIMGPAVAARSDHVALVAAFNGWVKAKAKGGRSAGSEFCLQFQLSESSLEAVHAGRAEYAGTLGDLGFVSRDDAQELAGKGRGRAGAGGGFDGSADSAWLCRPINRNWGNARFLKAAICAGFYPSILRVQPPKAKFKQVDGGAFEVEPSPAEVKFFDRERGRTFMHPGSVCFKIGRFDSGWMVFTSMTQTSKLFVREVSMAPVYSVLLFGGGLVVDAAANLLSVDGWAEFRAPASVGVLVKGLRAELDAVLAAKIRDPGIELTDSKAAAAVMELLSSDGF